MNKPMPITRRRLLTTGAALPLLASCASDLSRYRGDALPNLASARGVCAVAYATVKAGEAQPPVYVSGCSNATKTQADAVFQAASLTKPVVAFAALQLAIQGRLDLDAPVSRYLPAGYVHYHHVLRQGHGDPHDVVSADTLARIPVAALLNHTCGLPNWSNSRLTPAFEPGQQWSYSGEGYGLLQAVMQAVVGMPIARFMSEQVFKPLGMHDSSLVWQDAYTGRIVNAYAAAGTSQVPPRFRYPIAAASLYSTAQDYSRFLCALMADKPLLALTLSKPVTVSAALGLDWGYGWGIEHAANGINLWQWGNNPGFRNFAMFSPSSGDGFVIFTNSERGMPLAVPLAHWVLPSDHNAFRFGMVN